LELDGGEWSALNSGRSIPRERVRGINRLKVGLGVTPKWNSLGLVRR